MGVFFFFKQKTAYGMRISDWSSDVCSSDLAGIGMLPGVLELIPAAKVSVVGIKRDEESLAAKPYYENLVGDMADRTALILDPMLATGGTLVATVDMLKAAGATRIKGLFLVAAPEGLPALEATHPDVEVYTAPTRSQELRVGQEGGEPGRI